METLIQFFIQNTELSCVCYAFLAVVKGLWAVKDRMEVKPNTSNLRLWYNFLLYGLFWPVSIPYAIIRELFVRKPKRKAAAKKAENNG